MGIKNYNDKIGETPTKTAFKDVIDPNASLLEASSFLKNKEKYNQMSDRPLAIEEVE